MDLVDFARQNKQTITYIHLFGVFLGFGTVLIADIFFIRLLKNLTATIKELNILKTFSKIIWLGLIIIILSGILLFLSDIQKYSSSAKFLTKMVVVSVIIGNGILLNILVSPKLSSIPFRELMLSSEKNTINARCLMFASAAVSTISWWSAFILGLMDSSPLPFQILLAIYLFLLFIGIITSQIFEKIISRKKVVSS